MARRKRSRRLQLHEVRPPAPRGGDRARAGLLQHPHRGCESQRGSQEEGPGDARLHRQDRPPRLQDGRCPEHLPPYGTAEPAGRLPLLLRRQGLRERAYGGGRHPRHVRSAQGAAGPLQGADGHPAGSAEERRGRAGQDRRPRPQRGLRRPPDPERRRRAHHQLRQAQGPPPGSRTATSRWTPSASSPASSSSSSASARNP